MGCAIRGVQFVILENLPISDLELSGPKELMLLSGATVYDGNFRHFSHRNGQAVDL